MTIANSTKHRALFLSDFHLGSQHCKAKRLCDFLETNDADVIYLVGDVIESSVRHWPPFHDKVLMILAEKARLGTEIVFVPGNHDNAFRKHVGVYGNIKIAEYAIHRRAGGEPLFVVHGDETDIFKLDFLLRYIIKLETFLGVSLWEVLRKRFGRWISYHTRSFENKMIELAHDNGYLSVVCGHIHSPNISDCGALYLNPGDWTHHCTAIAEAHNGNFTMLQG